MNSVDLWEERHRNSKDRYNRITDFARFCFDSFMKGRRGRLLDLASGKGADSIFFHYKGMKVTAMDYSKEAIAQFNQLQNEKNIFISALARDISEPLPFEDSSFDYIYSRLGLQYFGAGKTEEVFQEISRVLRSSGLLMFQVKSTSDKKCGSGEKLEEDFYQDEEGYARHFFSEEYAKTLLEDWNILYIGEKKIPDGNAYLDVIAQKK